MLQIVPLSPPQPCEAEPVFAEEGAPPDYTAAFDYGPFAADVAGVRPPQGRTRFSRDVWDQARSAYLSGFSARQVCAHYGMSLGALRHRARTEGWRREDQPWAPAASLAWQDPDDEGPSIEMRTDGDLDQISDADLAALARARQTRAVLRGHAVEALRWKRIADLYATEPPVEPTLHLLHPLHALHPENAAVDETEATNA